jgi:hypothetical protein
MMLICISREIETAEEYAKLSGNVYGETLINSFYIHPAQRRCDLPYFNPFNFKLITARPIRNRYGVIGYVN